MTPKTKDELVPTGPWCCIGIIGKGLLDGPPVRSLDGDPGDTNGPNPPCKLNAVLLGPKKNNGLNIIILIRTNY